MDIGRVLRLVANCSRDDAVRDAEEKSVFCREAMVVPAARWQGASGKPRDNARGNPEKRGSLSAPDFQLVSSSFS